MSDGKSTWFKLFEAVAIVIGIFVSWKGLTVAQDALTEYKKDNSLTAFNILNDRESRIYDRLRDNDRLRSFWSYFPDSLDVKKKMEAQLRLLVPPARANEPKTPPLDLSFDDIKSLDEMLWRNDKFDDERYRHLREAYDCAEEMLFVAENAYAAYRSGAVSAEVWQTYETYIKEVGAHPLYLEAVYYVHEIGGYSKDFARLLQATYQQDAVLKKAALAVYPDIVKNSDWVETTGKRKAFL